jgi:hypothetical protein
MGAYLTLDMAKTVATLDSRYCELVAEFADMCATIPGMSPRTIECLQLFVARIKESMNVPATPLYYLAKQDYLAGGTEYLDQGLGFYLLYATDGGY